MDISLKKPPRVFSVKEVTLAHGADIKLAADELVTFHSPSGKALDFVAKDWGYYITGSTNGRMKQAGYRTVLAKNAEGLFYILAFELEKQQQFEDYLGSQKMDILAYLDQQHISLID